ncbi:hypothetical protein RND71_012390 [Anisodus tanguticus]|uniref:Uncharacterized protein n=1 Tax=Anisodus tanguticus TaxID=243964 RepID=A0AAE1SFS7_9SOLA|nr:hypothetical protein RND71_012390 [Anisodus tanguticus]
MERIIPEAPNSPKKATDCSIAEKNKKGLQFIEEVTTKVDEVQRRVLADILTRNAHVEICSSISQVYYYKEHKSYSLYLSIHVTLLLMNFINELGISGVVLGRREGREIDANNSRSAWDEISASRP